MAKQGFVYILSKWNDQVLYVGVTSNLKARVFQHKLESVPGFTSRYKVNKLVYYEVLDDMYNAIAREKQIKKFRRSKKIALVNESNSQWRDLYDEL